MLKSLDYNKATITSLLQDDKRIDIDIKTNNIGQMNADQNMLLLLNMNANFYDKTEDYIIGSVFSKLDSKNKDIGDIEETTSLSGNYKISSHLNLSFLTYNQFKDINQTFRI